MILEAIYDGYFEKCSHGFRPNHSCHTALNQIQACFTGVKWFIEGNIKSFFDNINHEIMINILSKRIKDERFLRLIRKFLKAEYLEDWTFRSTYSGTPRGGIISPILANIYLDRLDKYMLEYKESFDKGKCTAASPESYKSLQYVRYADNFIAGVIGSKSEAEEIKEQIKQFLFEKLRLELSDEKTLITHSSGRARFLGYDVFARHSTAEKRHFNAAVCLAMPIELMRKRLLDYGAMTIERNAKGKDLWKAKSRCYLKNNDDLEIIDQYNSEIRGFRNYYRIAYNSSRANRFGCIMQYSMFKTYAAKYRMSMKKCFAKFRIGKDLGVRYETKDGKMKTRLFYNEGFAKKPPIKTSGVDYIPQTGNSKI